MNIKLKSWVINRSDKDREVFRKHFHLKINERVHLRGIFMDIPASIGNYGFLNIHGCIETSLSIMDLTRNPYIYSQPSLIIDEDHIIWHCEHTFPHRHIHSP